MANESKGEWRIVRIDKVPQGPKGRQGLMGRIVRRVRCWAQREDLRLGEMVGVFAIGLAGGVFFWALQLLLEATQ